MSEEKFAIRFGLGAIKAVGFGMMETAMKEREENGKFADIYDFSKRLDPRSINKKSIEALAKAGAFDELSKNRRQLAESFEILSSYATKTNEEANSNQMSLFGGLPEANANPELKKTEDWTKSERLQKEFEAFGFFLNEHPLDDFLSDLRKRGVIFSDKLERDELEDGNLVKMAGVVSSSKHRSGARGRFAYLTISDPFGIFEAMIFDEALITSARDILVDGSSIALECLIRKDDGGVRILVREIKKLDEFIKNTEAKKEDFEDIKKQIMRNRNYDRNNSNSPAPQIKKEEPAKVEKKPITQIEIFIKSKDAIPSIRTILSRCIAAENQGTSDVFLIVDNNKIHLPQKYFLNEIEVLRIKNTPSVGMVKTA